MFKAAPKKTAEELKRDAEGRAAWTARCKPTVVEDAEKLRRTKYAEPELPTFPPSTRPERINSSYPTAHGTLKNPRKRARPPRSGAVQRVSGKALQEARDRDARFHTRDIHAGALVRAAGESEMPVRRRAMSSGLDRGTRRGRGWRRRCTR